MKATYMPIKKKQYEKVVNFLEAEKPDVIILNAKAFIVFSEAAAYPLVGRGAKKLVDISDRFYNYVKENFEVYSIYTPDIGREIKDEYRQMSLIQKIRLNLDPRNIIDVLRFLLFTIKIVFYGISKNDERLDEVCESFFKMFDKGEFSMPILNKVGRMLLLDSILLRKEIKKVVNKNKGRKIIYVGDKKDVRGLEFGYIDLK